MKSIVVLLIIITLIIQGGLMKSPFGHLIGMVAHVIAGITALHVGLVGLGVDVFAKLSLHEHLAKLGSALHYIVAGSGAVVLICVIYSLRSVSGCCCHSEKSCNGK